MASRSFPPKDRVCPRGCSLGEAVQSGPTWGEPQGPASRDTETRSASASPLLLEHRTTQFDVGVRDLERWGVGGAHLEHPASGHAAAGPAHPLVVLPDLAGGSGYLVAPGLPAVVAVPHHDLRVVTLHRRGTIEAQPGLQVQLEAAEEHPLVLPECARGAAYTTDRQPLDIVAV